VLRSRTGKKAACSKKLNERLGLSGRSIAPEHPRYVLRRKARSIGTHIDKYLSALEENRPQGATRR